MVTRRKLLTGLAIGGAAVAGAGYYALTPQPAEIGFDLTPDELDRAVAFLSKHPAIDAHAHPGRTFVHGANSLRWKLWFYAARGSFEQRTINDMIAGKVTAACFSGVSDFPVLDLGKAGLESVRPFANGEAWSYHQSQISNLRALVSNGLVTQILEASDITNAKNSGKPGAIFAMEGTDFLEGKPERVAHATDNGLRMITLVHYVGGGEVGDIITEQSVNNGLTGLGREVVGEINANRVMLDLAHASEKTAFDAIKASAHPVVVTHAHINTPEFSHPRFISRDLAQAIAEKGGYVGAWPAGIGITSLEGYVSRIVELIDLLGADHVAIGTDMDATYKPVFESYRKMPLVVGRLIRHGLPETAIAKVIGGNFLRVFGAVRGNG